MKSVAGWAILFLLFFGSCSKQKTAPAFDTTAWEEGDLVFRKGIGGKSQAVLTADTAGIYSHSGIVVKQNSEYKIVHITPGERENGETQDRIKIESPEIFFASDRASCGAVYRLENAQTVAVQAAQQALRLLQKNILFDHEYNLEDTTQLYCTELVSYVYELTGKDITHGKRNVLENFPIFAGTYIFPSDIYNNQECVLIYQF